MNGREMPVLSERLVDALWQAGEAGLSNDEIAAAVLLQTGLVKMSDRIDNEELVERCGEICRLMSGMKSRRIRR